MKANFGQFLCLLGIALIYMACQEEPKQLETVKTGKYDEFVRNPVTHMGNIDSSEAATIDFDETIIDFGTVMEGEVINHVFTFKNNGKNPLIISDARSTCGCTVPKWPKDPIEPGNDNEIEVSFNTENRPGYQDKPITIYSNTLPGKTVLRLKGTVNKKN